MPSARLSGELFVIMVLAAAALVVSAVLVVLVVLVMLLLLVLALAAALALVVVVVVGLVVGVGVELVMATRGVQKGVLQSSTRKPADTARAPLLSPPSCVPLSPSPGFSFSTVPPSVYLAFFVSISRCLGCPFS